MKAVFFDAYGTLVHLDNFFERLRERLGERGVRATLEQVRQAALAEIRYYKQHSLAGRDPQRLALLRRDCAGVLTRTLVEQGVAVPLSPEEATAVLLGGIRFVAYPEVPDALRVLKERGLRLGVVSNWDCSLPLALESVGLNRFFDFVVASAAWGWEKPDARIFREALRRAQVEPHEALHVGDSSERDVRGAQGVGIHAALLARDGGAPRVDAPVIRDLSAVPALLMT